MNAEIPTAPPVSASTDRDGLREAAVLGRYLIGRDMSDELRERYARGCSILFPREPEREERLLSFAVRHPRALPFLDAFTAAAHPESLLRRKLILALAVVETAPEHADFFARAAPGRLSLLWRLAAWGLTGALKVCVGAALYPLARRSS